MFEKDRTHSLTHFGWQTPFRQDFLALTYYYSYFYQEGKRTLFILVLLCLMFVLLLWSAKRTRFLTLRGWLLVGWARFLDWVFILIPSCTFFFTPLYLLYLSRYKHGLLSNSSACCCSVDESKAYLCFLSLFLCFYLSSVIRGWLMACPLFIFLGEEEDPHGVDWAGSSLIILMTCGGLGTKNSNAKRTSFASPLVLLFI